MFALPIASNFHSSAQLKPLYILLLFLHFLNKINFPVLFLDTVGYSLLWLNLFKIATSIWIWFRVGKETHLPQGK